MEIVFGIIVIIVFVAVVFGDGGSSPATGSKPPVRKPTASTASSAPRPYVAPASAQRAAHQREIERQRRADAAFFDGVIFGHYFIDEYGADDEQSDEPSAWADDHDDDFDDGMYD